MHVVSNYDFIIKTSNLISKKSIPRFYWTIYSGSKDNLPMITHCSAETAEVRYSLTGAAN